MCCVRMCVFVCLTVCVCVCVCVCACFCCCWLGMMFAFTAPKFEELAKNYDGKIKVCMINVVGGGPDEQKYVI